MPTGIHYFQSRAVPSFQVAVVALGLWTFSAAAQERPQIRPSDLEQQISTLVNAERQANNLNPLAVDNGLSKIARDHSQDMVKQGYFNHIDPDGKPPRSSSPGRI
jgi:uncharacterized protein YkwD